MALPLRLNRHLQSKTVARDVVGAYHPFGHQVAFLPAAGWDDLAAGRFGALPQWVLQDLAERRFLLTAPQEAQLVQGLDRGAEGLAEMWLVVVQSCNMACQYCVVEGNVVDERRRKFTRERPGQDEPVVFHPPGARPAAGTAGAGPAGKDFMTAEVALAACDMFERLLQHSGQASTRVTFYGGEPLLNRAAIRAAVPRLRQIRWPRQAHENALGILVITNGQIYDEELCAFFRKHRVMVSVSLDGMQHHHDAARVNLGGTGTFTRAAKSLERYMAAGLSCGICTTIGRHNVDDLPEIADYFADRFGVPVELQVPFDMAGGNRFYVPMVEAFPKAIEAYERLRRRGLLEALAFKRVATMASGAPRRADCSAIGSQVTVSPDGALGPCHSLVGERVHFHGHVSDPQCDPLQHASFREWAGRYPLKMQACSGCPAIGICGGGCPYNALTRKGSIWEKDPQQCAYLRAFVDWFIDDCWKRYDAATAPAWKAQPAAALA